MIKKSDIEAIVSSYSNEVRVGVLGSHSALEIGYGAKQEGLETIVVCERGRGAVYEKEYRNLFDHVIVLEHFRDLGEPKIQERLRSLNTLFIPNRSFSCYVGYDLIENEFRVPIMGNRFILRSEERGVPRDQYYLLDRAGLRRPKLFANSDEIDRLVIVKAQEKDRPLERAFFFATSPESFRAAAERALADGRISPQGLANAVIEEFVVGALVNANFFWSPLTDEIELLGFDRRIQTDLDGLLHLPAAQQLAIDLRPQNVEIGHMGATLRESQLSKIFAYGRRFVDACKREYPPGMIGLFALQGAITKELEFVIFDVSPRVPGCPCVETTSPYMKYKYMKEVGPGRRVAMEILRAKGESRLGEIVT